MSPVSLPFQIVLLSNKDASFPDYDFLVKPYMPLFMLLYP